MAQSTIDPTIPAQGSQYQSSLIRANFAAAANDINALYAIAAASGVTPVQFDTLAVLQSSLNYNADVTAIVNKDATVSNNGLYFKVGLSGTGSWSPLYVGAQGPQGPIGTPGAGPTSQNIAVMKVDQSNGVKRAPAVTTAGYANLLTCIGGTELDDFPDVLNPTAYCQRWANFATIAQAMPSRGLEPDMFGLGYQLLRIVGVQKVFAFTPGYGGRSLAQLSPGTVHWQALLASMRSALTGLPGSVPTNLILVNDRGEAEQDTQNDGGSGTELPATATQVTAGLAFLATAFRRACAALTNAPSQAPVFDNMKLLSSYGAASQAYQAGQLAAAQTIPGYYLMPPSYWPQYMAGDGIHGTGPQKRYKSEANGLAIALILGGQNWQPLQIVSATRTGTALAVTFNKPVAFDTTTWIENTTAGQSKGAMFYDGGSAVVALSAATIVSANVVNFTMASGVAGTLRMAQQPESLGGGNDNLSFPRSNIREVAALGNAQDGTPLYSFAIPQALPVT